MVIIIEKLFIFFVIVVVVVLVVVINITNVNSLTPEVFGTNVWRINIKEVSYVYVHTNICETPQ